ncbi:MAG TPA: T9SS type A sorting domain-containing protein, partial [Bacteroidia bacterium]|nr:T9SS type A sorting domain-containing protein [Bacteroidia bacterium]
ASINSIFAIGNYYGGYLQTGNSSHPYFASPGNPAALNGWYQLKTDSGDAFKVQLLAEDLSANIKGSATIEDSANTGAVWKQFSACISYTGAADSAEILFTLTGTRSNSNTHNGSYALVDDLSFGTCTAGIEEIGNNVTLESAYPNPANSICNIIYSIPVTSSVSIALYDLNGRKVMDLLNNSNQTPGRYKLPIDVHTLANGVYAYTITVDGIPYTQKMVVAK